MEEDRLLALVRAAVNSMEWDAVLVQINDLYLEASPGDVPGVVTLMESIVETLSKVKWLPTPDERDNQAEMLTDWLVLYTANFSVVRNNPGARITWRTMGDDRVRQDHRDVEGTTITVGETFDVGGYNLHFPGEPVGPPEIWYGCRCTAFPEATVAAAADLDTPEEVEEDPDAPPQDYIEEIDYDGPMAWHGVLAVEGVRSGDQRWFKPGALTHRSLPLPITVKHTNDNGWEEIGRIDRIWRKGNQYIGEGVFDHESPYTDRTIGQIAEGYMRGMSVEIDDAVGSAFEEDDWYGTLYEKSRVCSAAFVPVPAYQEAFIALGPTPQHLLPEEDAEVESQDMFAAEGSWDGSAARFTPQEWKRSCLIHVCDGDEKSCHKLPVREPGGALSRAGVHAAAARINQVDAPAEKVRAAKKALRGLYRELGESPPETLGGGVEHFDMFKRGKGWITDPVPTRRIHSYWTTPGQPGYLKIAWGTPGDFYRCRSHLRQYVSPAYLNRTCAQWHHDALGIWPGEHDANTLIASAAGEVSATFFSEPVSDGPFPLTMDGDHIYGFIASWNVCHIGSGKQCRTAPRSTSNYAYFARGLYPTDQGLIPVGPISVGGGHASLRAGVRAATEHYDNVSTAVADVAVGENKFGIWFSGLMRPEATAEQRRILMTTGAVSGDWRYVGPGQNELVAALVVNVPGFPIPRPSLVASANGADDLTLLALGVVEPAERSAVDEIRSKVRAFRMDRVRELAERM